MRQAARAYFETQVTTTSQGQLLIMLYDGAIKILNMAKERMAANDYAGKGKLISNAIDVINELASSLNAEKGGDLAANLSELYFYCNKRLFMANSRMDQAMIDEVIKILGGIRSAYAQIIDTPEAQAAMAGVPAPGGKAARSPAGMGAGASGGAPVPATKAHNAYAFMGATRNAAGRPTVNEAPHEAAPERTPAAESVPADLSRNDSGAAAPEFPIPELPATFDMPPAGAVKRAAAAGLYRKFT